MVTFVLATCVMVTFVHISNISVVTDLILTIKARSRQVQGKVKGRSSRKGHHGKVKANSDLKKYEILSII